MAVCALLGARLLGGADDTVGGLGGRARRCSAGQPVSAADLVRREVRFADQADADRYLSADAALPAGARWPVPSGRASCCRGPRSARRARRR